MSKDFQAITSYLTFGEDIFGRHLSRGETKLYDLIESNLKYVRFHSCLTFKKRKVILGLYDFINEV